MENSDGICHLYPSCFLKCGTTKSIKLDTSIQKAGLPWWLSSEESASQPANIGDMGSIPGSGRSPEEGNGNPLQYSCLENPRDGGAWWAAVYGVAQSWTRLK